MINKINLENKKYCFRLLKKKITSKHQRAENCQMKMSSSSE